MTNVLKRLMCRHVMCWSERRKGEVCYKCGKYRSAMMTRVLRLPDPDPERTLNIRFPTTAAGDSRVAAGITRPRTARD